MNQTHAFRLKKLYAIMVKKWSKKNKKKKTLRFI